MISSNCFAVGGSDFSLNPLSLTFPANSTYQNGTVEIIDDNILEKTEQFSLLVVSNTDMMDKGANFTGDAIITILDNDGENYR